MKLPKEIGEMAEAYILALLVEKGFKVLVPFGDSCRYDLAIERDGTVERIQVKHGRIKNDAILFSVKRNRLNKKQYVSKTYHGEVDSFAVWCSENRLGYLIPFHLVKDCKDTASLSLKKDRKKNQYPSRLAIDYQL